jgi:D-methionine transport system substrate-binding protein
MKKNLLFIASATIAAVSTIGLTSCGNDANTIRIAASELPHAKILKEAVAPVLKEKGYTLDVQVLDWTIQNSSVASGDYDANYFQHEPYLNLYNSSVSENNQLALACKVHFEKLCLYTSDTSKKTVTKDARIEIVNDISNIERALLLLQNNGILTINSSCYNSENEFVNFDTTNPNSCVTFTSDYANVKLTCLAESQLTNALSDYDFGVIPGNTALTGLGSDYASRIVYGEKVDEDTLTLRANGIAVKKSNLNSDKTKALVEAFGSESVQNYISKTFGESVVYHYINLIK